jgi:hypothetical protein
MDAKLIEHCAKSLWNANQSDLANQYKIFKKYGFVTWEQLNKLDLIPNVADEFRKTAELVIRQASNYIRMNKAMENKQ